MIMDSTPSLRRYLVSGAVLLWVLFTTGYVLADQWQTFKGKALNNAYQQARKDTLTELLKLAAQCQPINVELEGQKAQLVSTACQGGAQPPGPAPALPPPPPPPSKK